jgi:hypothetical protein
MSPRQKQEAYTEALDVLREWGIDPLTMVAAEIGESGYLTFRLDAFGKVATNDNGEALVEVNEWPKGFPAKEFIGTLNRARGF